MLLVRTGPTCGTGWACSWHRSGMFWCGSGVLLVQNRVPDVGRHLVQGAEGMGTIAVWGHFLMAATRPGMAASIWSAMVSNPDASPNQGSSSGVPGVTEGS